MARKTLFLILVILILMIGCESPQETRKTAITPATEPEPKKLPTYQLLREPMDAELLESSSEALPVWRKSRASQPVLVLLSNDPFLQPIPQERRSETVELIMNGSATDLAEQLRDTSPDPMLLPQMALSTALQCRLFSRVVWVISGDESFKEQTTETFTQHLVNYGAISPEEAQTFSRNELGFSGQLYGLPVTAVHESSLPAITEPVLLHIDLSYFKPIYKGEIKTPLYTLLYQTLDKLRTTNISAEAISISLSNRGGNLPLSTRFLGTTLARFFAEPELLDQPLPESWDIRRKALYLENFFQKDKVHDLYLQLRTNTPQDASVSYALYQSLRELKRGTEALVALAEAVLREPVYGLEYLTLSSIALEKKRPDQALKMLDLAIAAFPENPFIQLQKAELLIRLEHAPAAKKLLEELQQIDWSEDYYPQLPDYIDSLLSLEKEKD